jgi:hypothetical protein
MKPQRLEDLKKEYDAVHGCYRPEGGPCFYIASGVTTADYGRRKGRHFVATVEDRDGTLVPRITLTLLVGTMAQRVWAEQIGNLDEFCRDVGLDRLRDALARDWKTERHEEILLTKDSGESEFRRPNSAKAIRRYQSLKSEIIHFLASRHAQGHKGISASAVLEWRCEDPALITRALNELVERSLIRDLNRSAGMRLTAEGQKMAEEALVPEETPSVSESPAVVKRFDFFISYASEDRQIAKTLEKALVERDYNVWRDRGQLTLGDSLTAKINEGLAASRFGIVILSRDFLRKNWPQAELNALQARAINTAQKVVLPIRRNLTHEEMAERLPLMGDKLTIACDDENLDRTIEELVRAAGR